MEKKQRRCGQIAKPGSALCGNHATDGGASIHFAIFARCLLFSIFFILSHYALPIVERSRAYFSLSLPSRSSPYSRARSAGQARERQHVQLSKRCPPPSFIFCFFSPPPPPPPRNSRTRATPRLLLSVDSCASRVRSLQVEGARQGARQARQAMSRSSAQAGREKTPCHPPLNSRSVRASSASVFSPLHKFYISVLAVPYHTLNIMVI